MKAVTRQIDVPVLNMDKPLKLASEEGTGVVRIIRCPVKLRGDTEVSIEELTSAIFQLAGITTQDQVIDILQRALPSMQAPDHLPEEADDD